MRGSGNPSEKLSANRVLQPFIQEMNDTEIIILILVFFNFGFPPLARIL